MSLAQTSGLTTEQLQNGIKTFQENISKLYQSVNVKPGQPVSHRETAFLIDKNREFISKFEEALETTKPQTTDDKNRQSILLGLLIIGGLLLVL